MIITLQNILITIAAIIIFWLIFAYNGLVRGRYRVREAWADIDVQLKRRYDLIPNLVEIVKGYAGHEKETFAKVTEARAAALGAQNIKDKETAENNLSSALKSIFAIAEAYPQLRAVESFVNLQNELEDTENKIQAARRFYNGNVMDFNTRVETFPTNLIAGIFHFQKEDFFQLQDSEAREAVKVKF